MSVIKTPFLSVLPFALACILRIGLEFGMLLHRVRYLHFFSHSINFYLSKHDQLFGLSIPPPPPESCI